MAGMPTTVQIASKLPDIGVSIFSVMTRLANEHQAINLSQGFPDFAAPARIKEAACAAINADVNQYAVTWGARPLREARSNHRRRRGRHR